MVSVLIPCFNSEEFIADTITSVLEQTYQDIEIIIVDDGSIDKSIEVARSFASEKIRIVEQLNSGASKARNLAFEYSRGEYIQYLDADDLLSRNKIETQVRSLENETGSVSASNWRKFENSIENLKDEENPDLSHISIPTDLLLELWSNRSMIACHSWMVPRGLVIKAGPWNESLKINQDGEFFCRVLLEAKKVIFDTDGMAFYRTGIAGSVSRSKGDRAKAESLLRSYFLYKNHLSHLSNELRVKKALATNFYSYIYIYYHEFPDLVKMAIKAVEELGIEAPLGKVGGAMFEKYAPIFGFYNLLRARRIKYYFLGGR